MVIIEKSTLKGLIGVLDGMNTPKKDILIMELYYESERKKTYEQLEKSLKTTKAKLKVYQDREKEIMKEISERLNAPVFEPDYNCPGWYDEWTTSL